MFYYITYRIFNPNRIFDSHILQHEFGPLLSDKKYRFQVNVVSRREHGLGDADIVYTLSN